MTTKELIIDEIQHMPESLLDEVKDFILFVKSKVVRDHVETAIASESSLEKDWLKPEEDEAWQAL